MNKCCMPMMMCCCNCQEGQSNNVPSIGENGNWYIGDTDTGVSAQGPKGDKGEPGADGVQGAKGDKGDTGAQGVPGVGGLFSVMETIFDGKADTVGQTYNLTKSITDYKTLVVEVSCFKANVRNVKDYEWILDPVTSQVSSQHRFLRGVTLNESGVLKQNFIQWNFPTQSSLRMNHIQTITDEIDYKIAITKVYGLK